MVKIGGAQQQQDQAFGLSDLDLDDDQLTTMSDKSDEIDEKGQNGFNGQKAEAQCNNEQSLAFVDRMKNNPVITVMKNLILQKSPLRPCNIAEMSNRQYVQEFTSKRHCYVGTDQSLQIGEQIPRPSSGLFELIKCDDGGDESSDSGKNIVKLRSPLHGGAFFDGFKFDADEEDDAQKFALLEFDIYDGLSADALPDEIRLYFGFTILQFINGSSEDDGDNKCKRYLALKHHPLDNNVCIEATEFRDKAARFAFTPYDKVEKPNELLSAGYYFVGDVSANAFLSEEDTGHLDVVKRESKKVGKFKIDYNIADTSGTIFSTKRHKFLYRDCGVFLFDAPNLESHSAKFEFGPMMKEEKNGKVFVRSPIRSLANNEFLCVVMSADGCFVGIKTVLDESSATVFDFVPMRI